MHLAKPRVYTIILVLYKHTIQPFKQGYLHFHQVQSELSSLLQEDVRETAAGSGAEAKQDYWGALVLLNADGQSFDTVMAAINSSRCATCDVVLVVERQIGGSNKVSWATAFVFCLIE